jgi:hypothetical protein
MVNLHDTQQIQETKSMHSTRFEPAVPAIKQLQTCALDRTATGNGGNYIGAEFIPNAQ